jgi:anti-sigma B factor antagonist
MLTITNTSENECSIIALEGEVDASNSVMIDEAIQKLIGDGSKSIVVDGQKLEYISSAGLGVFMSYLEDFEEKNVDFKIFGLTEGVLEVFKILGLHQLMNIYPTKESAFNS